jgi:hypothetical protein
MWLEGAHQGTPWFMVNKMQAKHLKGIMVVGIYNAINL